MNIKRIYLLLTSLIFIQKVEMDLLKSIKDLQIEFDEMVKKTFSIFKEKSIEEKYVEIYKMGGIEMLPVNPLDIAKDFSQQLANEFRKKMESLKRAVDFAEEEARNYKWNPDIKPEDVSYIDSKKVLENDTLFVEHPLFKSKVISNQSSVHIPTEIFEEDEKILNTLKWLSNVDNVFSRNVQSLRYQYFASVNGPVVQFPGMKWRKKGIDMFDVRRRQWYVQGASSPKDVMILIDTSGSMHGISIGLTKKAVIKLIDTMGENDYVAVAQFPGVVKSGHYAPHLLLDSPSSIDNRTACFETFVQANKRNKDRLLHQTGKLQAKGIAHLDDALKFAITEFHKFDNRSQNGNEGANCNRLIVVFTDSGDEYNRDNIRELMKMSNKTKNIRIFIYYVGEEITPIDLLKNRTCDYRGYFGHIKAMGAVSSIIDKYSTTIHYHTIHKENKLGENEFRVDFASMNDEGFHNPEDFPPLGLGLMTSLTMPVYNRSGNGSFLGLLGTDMTVAFMDDLVPHNKLGPNGYAFAINTNGYIIFHPELKNQQGWMRDPPNVDFTEIEFNSDTKSKIRNKIIDCAASNGTQFGENDVSSLIKVPDEIHTYENVRSYAYVGVPYSTFGVAMVNPKYNKFYAKYSPEIKFEKVEECSPTQCSIVISLPEKKNITLKFTNDVFLYSEVGLSLKCKLSDDDFNNSFSSLGKIHDATTASIQKTASHLVPITTMDSTLSGSITILQNSFMSSSVTDSSVDHQNKTVSTVVKFSNELMKILHSFHNKSNDKCPSYVHQKLVSDLYALEELAQSLSKPDSITSVIVTTFIGLTMVFPESEKHVYKDMFDNSTNSAIFQRVFDMRKIIFYAPFNRNSLPNKSMNKEREYTNPNITMFKDLSVEITTDRTIPAAVLGVSIKHSVIVDLLWKYEVCNKTRFCYLVEDGGYVISVNNPLLSHQIGFFFGNVNPAIMNSLIKYAIFKRVEDYDYQAICPKEKEDDISSSSSRLKPFVNLISFPIIVFKKIISYLENLYLFIKLFIHVLLHQLSSAQEATATDNKYVSCIKKFNRYYLQPDSTNTTQELIHTCDNCTFTYIVQRMTSSNLIIVSFDKTCQDNCTNVDGERHTKFPIRDYGPDICKLSNEPRYRLRPNHKCYGFDPDEDFMRCHSGRPSFTSTIYYLLTFIFTTKSLLIINDLYL